MNVNDCRDGSLDLILRDACDHPDYNGIVAHLDGCNHCQSRLDELTAGASWWKQTRQALSDSTLLSMPADLPDLGTVVTAEVGSPEQTGQRPVEYSDITGFLAPPRHPEMLGRIGKYEVEREIGRGGMGIVVKGFDSELNRPVAIKLLAPHLASGGTARQRFIREARAAAAVVHDNVIAIHGIETDGPLPAIVMPLISGSSLRSHVEEHGAMDAVDVVRIGIQIAAGLSAAHAQGLVHRDIKPANILLENDLNRVQITDFGLARAAHDSNLTHSGVIAGTPHFMSPEQALGESVDQRSDLFSLGSVLYFMSTGELPFGGSTPMGVLQRVCNVEPNRVREINSAVPEQLESVIEKLLEKHPGNRFESANDLQGYLGEYLAHLQQPTNRKAPRRLITASRRARRRRLIVGGVFLVGLATLGSWSAGFFAGSEPTSDDDVETVATLNEGDEAESAQPESTSAPAPAAPTPPNLRALAEIDRRIGSVKREIRALEATPIGEPPQYTDPSADALGQIGSAVSALETPRSVGAATEFDTELRSIDAAIRRIEQTFARPSSSTSNQGQ